MATPETIAAKVRSQRAASALEAEDLRRILAVTQEIQGESTMPGFLRKTHEGLLELIAADNLSIAVTRFRPGMRAVAVEAYGSPPFTREHFEYYSKNALEHPYAKHFVETDSGEALRISDLVPVREWTRNPFWKFTLEHLGYRYGLLAVWPLGRNTIFNVDFERRERDFSRRDKHVLDVCMCALGPQYSILARLARRRAPAAKTVARTKRAVPSAGEMTPLTPREDEVLRWVGQGKDNAEIGIILGISPRTAQKHVENILKKLQLENRYAATIYAAQNADGGDSVL